VHRVLELLNMDKRGDVQGVRWMPKAKEVAMGVAKRSLNFVSKNTELRNHALGGINMHLSS
jgi:hypothetical protein